jgi:L-idonate 5-dehydrogenase
VVVTGCGPIGALLIGSLRRAGAAEIIAVDIAEAPLAYALAMGADRAINIANAPDTLVTYQRDKGYFDYLFEASGSPSALHNALDLVRPRGVIVAVGLGGDISVPMNKVVSKELALRGSFRFDREFEEAVHFLDKRLIDVQPVFTGVLPFHEASAAFELASDRVRSMKVQLSFE